MAVASKREARPTPSTSATGVVVLGAPRTPLRDVYHLFLRASWPAAIGFIVVAYMLLNVAFGAAYLAVGGVHEMRAYSLWDAFCFSVQTMGTVGYGAMYPSSAAANAIVVVESVTSLLVTALATGLVFSKFSLSTARVAFSRQVVIALMDGVPTLSFRVGNERGNQILEATVRVSIVRTERTREGSTFYRMYDLRLSRERSQAIARSWTVLHPITTDSPLHGATPESLARDEVELLVSIVGVDDTSMQPVHARRRYLDSEVVWGARHADILSEDDAGNLVLDVRRFHELEPTKPTEAFPYPR